MVAGIKTSVLRIQQALTMDLLGTRMTERLFSLKAKSYSVLCTWEIQNKCFLEDPSFHMVIANALSV